MQYDMMESNEPHSIRAAAGGAAEVSRYSRPQSCANALASSWLTTRLSTRSTAKRVYIHMLT